MYVLQFGMKFFSLGAAKRVGFVLLLLTLANLAIGCAGVPKASPEDAKTPVIRESKRVSFTQASKDSREFDLYEANEWYINVPRRGDDQGKYQHLDGSQGWRVVSTLT
ncbi:MAG: hypothetical protein KDB07_06915, partial [Planctomycetes bacterium]|nr:hypothetical protein [Planctomycetota bacterium]